MLLLPRAGEVWEDRTDHPGAGLAVVLLRARSGEQQLKSEARATKWLGCVVVVLQERGRCVQVVCGSCLRREINALDCAGRATRCVVTLTDALTT
jgi:hypothetical protein